MIYSTLNSCSPALAHSSPTTVAIRNESGGIVRNAQITNGSFSSVGGTIYPGTTAHHTGSRIPALDNAQLTWVDANGTSHSAPLAPSPRGDLLFTIRKDDSVQTQSGPTLP